MNSESKTKHWDTYRPEVNIPPYRPARIVKCYRRWVKQKRYEHDSETTAADDMPDFHKKQFSLEDIFRAIDCHIQEEKAAQIRAVEKKRLIESQRSHFSSKHYKGVDLYKECVHAFFSSIKDRHKTKEHVAAMNAEMERISNQYFIDWKIAEDAGELNLDALTEMIASWGSSPFSEDIIHAAKLMSQIVYEALDKWDGASRAPLMIWGSPGLVGGEYRWINQSGETLFEIDNDVALRAEKLRHFCNPLDSKFIEGLFSPMGDGAPKNAARDYMADLLHTLEATKKPGDRGPDKGPRKRRTTKK